MEAGARASEGGGQPIYMVSRSSSSSSPTATPLCYLGKRSPEPDLRVWTATPLASIRHRYHTHLLELTFRAARSPPLLIAFAESRAMSGHDEEQHPDLERFYAQLVSGGDEDDPDWVDEDDDDADDDAAYEVYFDPDDMDDEDDDEFMEDDEDDDDAGLDDGEDDEDMGNATALGDQITLEFDPNDESSGRTFLELASLLNSAGGSADARSSLLARLLAGPRDTGPATRSGSQGLLRRLGLGGMSAEERERQARAEAERRRKEKWWKPQTEPNPRGVELLKSGEFGRVGDWRSGGGRHRVRSRAGDVKRSHGYIPPMSAVGVAVSTATAELALPQPADTATGHHTQHKRYRRGELPQYPIRRPIRQRGLLGLL